MNSFIKIILSLFLIQTSIYVKGQLNYKPGSIVTTSNDTLRGFINDGGIVRNARYCWFKTGLNDKPVKYFPTDLKSYRLGDDKYYYSHALNTKNKIIPVFMDVLLEGTISLYCTKIDKMNAYHLKKKDGSVIGLKNDVIEFNNSVTGAQGNWNKAYKIEFQQYKETLMYLFANSGITYKQVLDLEYNAKSLQHITATYIDSTCEAEQCITYTRDLSKKTTSYGIFSGVQVSQIHFTNAEFGSDLESAVGVSYPVGLFYNSPVNLISDRFLFQMEFAASKLNYQPKFTKISNDVAYVNMNSTVLAVPVFFSYRFVFNKFQATLGLGKEMGFVINSKFQYIEKEPISSTDNIYGGVDYQIHYQQKGGWLFDIGMAYKAHPKFSLYASTRLQRQYNLIIEEKNTINFRFNLAKENNLGKIYKTSMVALRFGICF